MTRFLSNLLKLQCTIPMIVLAFAADFVHCVDAFKSDVKKTPRSFSSLSLDDDTNNNINININGVILKCVDGLMVLS